MLCGSFHRGSRRTSHCLVPVSRHVQVTHAGSAYMGQTTESRDRGDEMPVVLLHRRSWKPLVHRDLSMLLGKLGVN
jgi:hypothetical protein